MSSAPPSALSWRNATASQASPSTAWRSKTVAPTCGPRARPVGHRHAHCPSRTAIVSPVWSAAAGTLSATGGDAVTWTAPPSQARTRSRSRSAAVVRVGQRFSLDVVAAPAVVEPE
jgi:hypothetical protein